MHDNLLEKFEIIKQSIIDGSPITIISGITGSGKSTLMLALEEFFENNMEQIYPNKIIVSASHAERPDLERIDDFKETSTLYLIDDDPQRYDLDYAYMMKTIRLLNSQAVLFVHPQYQDLGYLQELLYSPKAYIRL